LISNLGEQVAVDPSKAFEAKNGFQVIDAAGVFSGGDTPTFDCEIGSLYLKTNGARYTKTAAGTGSDKWTLDGTSSSVTIPEYGTDPVSPATNDAWVLRENAGQPHGGLLLAITNSVKKYYHSYKTVDGSIVRVELK
jgi:hypothetical protein